MNKIISLSKTEHNSERPYSKDKSNFWWSIFLAFMPTTMKEDWSDHLNSRSAFTESG